MAWYMRELNRCPPEHYKQVGVDQVLAADREVFQRLGELTRGGLSLAKDGKLPLDAHLPKVMAEPRIMNLLSPLHQTGGSPRAAPSGGHTRER